MMSAGPGHQEKEVVCFAEKVRANGVGGLCVLDGGLRATFDRKGGERRAGEIGTTGDTAEYVQHFFHFLLKLSVLTRLKCFV